MISVEENLSCENGTSSGMQSNNRRVVTDVTMSSQLNVPTPVTANMQRTVYSHVEMKPVANKWPISEIT
eukprot:10394674-Ditylum_brightwellii.AAC.1